MTRRGCVVMQYHSGLPSGSVHLAHEDVLEAARCVSKMHPISATHTSLERRPYVIGAIDIVLMGLMAV